MEVNGEGKRRVVGNNYKGGWRSFKWVTRSQREHMLGLETFGDTLTQQKPVVGSDQDIQVGSPNVPNLESTGPIRMEVGESSSLADRRPPTPVAHVLVKPNTSHEAFVA